MKTGGRRRTPTQQPVGELPVPQWLCGRSHGADMLGLRLQKPLPQGKRHFLPQVRHWAELADVSRLASELDECERKPVWKEMCGRFQMCVVQANRKRLRYSEKLYSQNFIISPQKDNADLSQLTLCLLFFKFSRDLFPLNTWMCLYLTSVRRCFEKLFFCHFTFRTFTSFGVQNKVEQTESQQVQMQQNSRRRMKTFAVVNHHF